MRNCPHCGERMAENEAAHDTVMRIVRPRMLFAGKKSGEAVEVCKRHEGHRSTLLGTMSIGEWEALMAPKPAPRPAGRSSVAMAAEFFDRLKAEYEAEKARRGEKEDPDPRRVRV